MILIKYLQLLSPLCREIFLQYFNISEGFASVHRHFFYHKKYLTHFENFLVKVHETREKTALTCFV